MPDSTVYRKPLISGNWKMHNNHFEAIQSLQKLAYLLTKDDYSAVDVSIHPPFTDIRSVQTLIDADELRIHLGAQNCHWEEKGAFTGEVAAAFLAKLGVQYVIVGHSERREIFGETDADVSKKITTVQKLNMYPIVCVGETLEEREAGKTTEKVIGQVRAALVGRTVDQVCNMVIAYEPIWAIGTGKSSTAADANEVIGYIRSVVQDTYGKQAAKKLRIQYGGSVKPANISEFMRASEIDGALVGGASLEPASYIALVEGARG